LAMELQRDETWQHEQIDSFRTLARQYLWPPPTH
jgi:hypothetical protein